MTCIGFLFRVLGWSKLILALGVRFINWNADLHVIFRGLKLWPKVVTVYANFILRFFCVAFEACLWEIFVLLVVIFQEIVSLQKEKKSPSFGWVIPASISILIQFPSAFQNLHQ